MKRKTFTTLQTMQRNRIAHVIGRMRFVDDCIRDECYRTARYSLKETIKWLKWIGKDI